LICDGPRVAVGHARKVESGTHDGYDNGKITHAGRVGRRNQ
jgi:hypothetical protein